MCDDPDVDPRGVETGARGPTLASGGEGGDPRESPRGPSLLAHAAACVALLLLTLLLYAPDLDLGWFRVDDEPYVPHNVAIQAVTLANVGRIATEPYFANYSPVHLYAYMLDWALAGDDARAFHLSSNVWGGLCAAWVYVLAWYLFRKRSLAWAAALLFVVHPAHVEAIAWVASRKDLVSTFFAVPCLIAYLEGRRRASVPWYAASIALFLLALAGKLSVVVLPAVMLLFDLLVERRKGLGMLLDKLPFGILAVYFGLRVMEAQPPPFRDLDPLGLTAVLGQFVWLLTGFGEHVVFRPLPGSGASALPWALLAAAAVLTPSLLARRLPRLTLVLAGWVVVALIPSQVLRFAYPVSDRYLFYPSIPFALLIVSTVLGPSAALGGVARRRLGALALAALGAFWAFKTCTYLAEWSDPRSLWHAASRKVEDVYVHQFLGEHYQTSAERLLDELRTDARPGARSALLIEALGFDGSTPDVLAAEWARAVPRRPMTERVTTALLDRARVELEAAAAHPADRINVELHYNRARNGEMRGEDEAARAAYERAWQEAAAHPQDRIRWPYQALSSYGLSTLAERRGDVESALELMRRAQDEQARGGQPVLSGLAAEIERLEALRGR